MVQTQKSTSSASVAQSPVGTLGWMAPEVFDGKFSQKSDVFSFTVLMFEIVSLKLPYDVKSPEEIAKLVMKKFEFSKKQEKRGVSAAQQEAECLEDNPLRERRPDLGKVQSG